MIRSDSDSDRKGERIGGAIFDENQRRRPFVAVTNVSFPISLPVPFRRLVRGQAKKNERKKQKNKNKTPHR